MNKEATSKPTTSVEIGELIKRLAVQGNDILGGDCLDDHEEQCGSDLIVAADNLQFLQNELSDLKHDLIRVCNRETQLLGELDEAVEVVKLINRLSIPVTHFRLESLKNKAQAFLSKHRSG